MATSIVPALRHPLAISRWFSRRAVARAAAPSKRDLRLDFFRGLSLLFIFIDHIPNNFLSNVTLHSVAFSDAAEVFVFISGYAAALAYGSVLGQDGLPIATARIYHRVWQLYVAHVFIFAIFAAIVSYSIAAVDDPSYTQAFNLSQFLDDPYAAIGQVLILRFQPKFLDILPLYIVLLACFPPVLAVIARKPMYALVPSGVLYVLTHLMGWQMPGYPDGATWFFNPLAWQFLFVIGAVVGHSKVSGVAWVPQSRWLFRLAMTFAALVALVSASWMIQSNFTDKPDFLFTLLAPYVGDKSNLNPMRLASFLALALTTAQLVRSDSSLLATQPAKWLIACGQNSLHIFCLGILLSVLGQFVLTSWDDGMAMQALVDLVGGVLMIGLALLLAWDKAEARGPRARETTAAASR